MISVDVGDEAGECYNEGGGKAENIYQGKRCHQDDLEFGEYSRHLHSNLAGVFFALRKGTQ